MQRGDGFVEEGQDQPVFQIVGGGVAGWNLRFLRAAVLPAIQALAVFLAALAGFGRRRERGGNRQAQEGRKFGADADGDIQTDGVDEFDRAHRHAELHCGLVDDRRGNAFGICGGGFQHVREQQTVDEEARRARDRHRQFVDGFAECGEAFFGIRRHAVVMDDFHQRHHRDRVEIVQAGELRGARDVLAQFGQRDRRRVGGQQRVGLHPRFDGGIQVALGVGPFDDGFDQQIGLRDAFAVEIRHQPRGDFGAFAFVFHALGEQFLRAAHRGVDEALLAVLQGDVEALVGGPRGDVAAHHARADHMHVLDAVILAAQAFQAFLQEIHAGEIACGGRCGEFDHRPAFGIQQLLHAAAAAPPGFDQCVRRGVVVFARLARDLFDHLRRQQLARGPGVGDPRGEVLFERAVRAFERERGGGVDEIGRVDDAVDHAQRLRGRCRQGAAGEHEVHRGGRADQARQTHAAAPAGIDAQLHFGQADAGGGIVGHDAIAAGQRDFGAAAHAESVDRGDGGEGQVGDALEDALAAEDGIADGAFRVERLELADIGACDEAFVLGRAQDHCFRRLQHDPFQQAVEFDQHVLAEGVDRFAFTVEGQHQHAVGAQLGLPVVQIQAVEAGQGSGHDHESIRWRMSL